MQSLATLDPVTSLDSIFEAASDAILTIDLESRRVTGANGRVEELTGHPLAVLIGGDVALLTPGPSPDGVGRETPFDETVFGRAGLHEEVAFARADGFTACATVRVAHTSAAAPQAVCVVRDDNERRMLERELITKHVALRGAHAELEERFIELDRLSEALRQRQLEVAELSARMSRVSKRAMLGEVVAEVAHSLNNPLAAVTSSLRVLGRFAEHVSPGEPQDRYRVLVERCAVACDRMAGVVEDLRQACRGGVASTAIGPLDLTEEVRDALALFAHRLGGAIKVDLVLAGDVRVFADRDDVHHVLSNVIDNALYAIGDKGTLRIATRIAGEWGEVEVSDTGAGIDPAQCETIFEPFFTTKKRGQGTGLGLSMVRRSVARWGGAVEVEPRGALGGATFRIRLRSRQSEASHGVGRP